MLQIVDIELCVLMQNMLNLDLNILLGPSHSHHGLPWLKAGMKDSESSGD